MKYIILTVCLMSTGCAGLTQGWTTASPMVDHYADERYQNTFQGRVNSWINRPIDELVGQWGYPTREFVAPNGHKVYAYESAQNYQQASFQTPAVVAGATVIHGATLGGGQYVVSCQILFEVDDENVIVATRWSGNGCQ